LGTRIFNKPEADGTSTFYALPLLDMANHANNCPHYNEFKPCAFDASRECVHFTAGADVAAGQEVCFFYGYLLPDRALLEYGYLPQPTQQQQLEEVVPQLSSIDRHDADFESEPLPKLVEEPQPFTGACAALPQDSGHCLSCGAWLHVVGIAACTKPLCLASNCTSNLRLATAARLLLINRCVSHKCS
jgi:hypothetical protein